MVLLSLQEFDKRVILAKTQTFEIKYMSLSKQPVPSYKIELDNGIATSNITITESSLFCDCLHFSNYPYHYHYSDNNDEIDNKKTQSICKHLLFLFYCEGLIPLETIFQYQLQPIKEYWIAIEDYFYRKKWNQSKLSSTSSNSCSEKECSICFTLLENDCLSYCCTRCSMKTHMNCIYDFIKSKYPNDDQLPSLISCFICSQELPLLPLAIHAPLVENKEQEHNKTNLFTYHQPEDISLVEQPLPKRHKHSSSSFSSTSKHKKYKLHPDYHTSSSSSSSSKKSLQTILNRFFTPTSK